MAIGKVNVKLNALSHRKASSAVLLARASVLGAFSPFFVDIRRFLSRLNFGTKKGPTAKSFTHGEQRVERKMTYESHLQALANLMHFWWVSYVVRKSSKISM